MRSITTAIAWEHWKRNIPVALVMLSIACGIMGCIRWIFMGGMEIMPESLGNLYFVFLFIQFLCFSNIFFRASADRDGISLRMPRWLHVLPISTQRLVLTRLIIAALIVSSLSLLCCLFFIWTYGPIPVAGLSVLWVVTSVLLLQAFAWLPIQNSLIQLVGVIAYFYVQGAFLVYARRDWQEIAILKSPTTDRAALAVVSLVCAVIAWIGVSMDRRGGSIRLLPGKEWWQQRFRFKLIRSKPFGSPSSAQFWYEWRRKGLAMPLIFLVAVGIYAIYWLCLYIFQKQFVLPQDMLVGLIGTAIGVPTAGAFTIGFLAGQRGTGKNPMPLGSFQATLPVTDKTMGHAILRNGTCTLGLTWVLAALTIAMGIIWYWFRTTGAPFSKVWAETLATSPDASPLYTIAFALIASWALFGIGTSSFAIGRTRTLAFIAMAGIGIPFFTLVLSVHLFPHLGRQLGLIYLLLIFLGQLAIFLFAWRRRMVPLWLIICALIWLPLLILFSPLKDLLLAQPDTKILLCFLYAASLLPFLPFASVPTALFSNRHR